MNNYIRSRIKGIQDSLLAAYNGGVGMPSAMIGGERELVLHGLFREILPPIYRFGQGAITDAKGQLTGQVDLVMELPFGPSFPMPAGTHRLYLAESVAAVVEIKSNLSSQWDEAAKSTALVRKLDRSLQQTQTILMESSPEPDKRIASIPGIPCYAIGFKGYKTIESLKNRLEDTATTDRPDGVLIIESGVFVGLTGNSSGEEGIFRLIAELTEVFNAAVGVAYPSFTSYLDASR